MKRLLPLFFLASSAFAQTQPSENNRITLWGGYGPDGLERVAREGNTIIKPYDGPLLGLSYARKITESFSLTGELLHGIATSSPTYIWMGGVGFDF